MSAILVSSLNTVQLAGPLSSEAVAWIPFRLRAYHTRLRIHILLVRHVFSLDHHRLSASCLAKKTTPGSYERQAGSVSEQHLSTYLLRPTE